MKIAAIILASIVIVYILVCFSSLKFRTNPAIQYAIKQLQLKGNDNKTLVISATTDINTTPEKAWAFLIKINDWKKWQYPLVQSIRSSKDTITNSGDRFEQLLDLGFPVGSVISKETIAVYEPGKILCWKKDEKGIQSCHVWMIAQLTANSIRVYNCEVFHGSNIACIKVLVHSNWNALFMRSNSALKAALEKQ